MLAPRLGPQLQDRPCIPVLALTYPGSLRGQVGSIARPDRPESVGYRAPIDDQHHPDRPPWDPTTEAWPGGPHPGAIHEMQMRERQRHEMQAAAEEARQRTTFLLLSCDAPGIAIDASRSSEAAR